MSLNITSFQDKSEDEIYYELTRWIKEDWINEVIENRFLLLNLISLENLFEHLSSYQIHATETVGTTKPDYEKIDGYTLVKGDYFSIFYSDSGNKKLAECIN